MDELQLEEQQKNIQQRRDEDPYDPNAAARFPGGYTPVGDGVDNTQIEEVDPANVGAVEVTNPQVEDFRNLETLGSSGGVIIDGANLKNISPEALKQLQITPIQNASLDFILNNDGNVINTVDNIPDSGNEDPVVNPPVPPVDPPVDPPVPPVDPPVDPDPEDPDPEDPDPEDPDPEDPDPEDPDPEDPDPEDPDPEDPDPEDPDPEDPDPEDPDPEDPDPEDPDPEDPDPEDPDPEDPDPEDPDPEDPDPEDPGRGNPGNDKEVGNSPWDGETGASDNPGKGNHQDGLDPETNQPPGDSKNDGGQGNNPQNDNDNGGGGGKPEKGENNGFGNGDQDPPGNSGANNNAENDQSPDGNIGLLIDKFVEENPGTQWHEDFTDDYEPGNIDDAIVPDFSEIHEPSVHFDTFDTYDDYN